MADKAEQQQFFDDVKQAAGAIERIAREEPVFAATVDALRAQDAESYRDILGRLELLDRCRVVCDWFCAKECVVLCLELCGPPTLDPEELPDPREFAEVVARVTQDEELVELLATAIQERDSDAWRELIERQKLERFCHLLCHWACMVHCRLVCQFVCGPAGSHRGHLIQELVAGGRTLRALLEHKREFNEVIEAVVAQDCDRVRNVFNGLKLDGDCFVVCEWFCSWRCLRICLLLCRPFPLERPEISVKEMWEFGKIVGKLSKSPELEPLARAALREDAEAFVDLVKKLQLERFCIQLCHWFCFFSCRVFCRCVCRPPFDNPLFTHVGDFHIYADIDPGTGLTNKQIFGHGGPDFGFFGCLHLIGFCPKTSPNFPGVPMRYRFLFQELPSGTPTPLVGDMLCGVNVGYRLISWPDVDTSTLPFTTKTTSSFQSQTVAVQGSGATPGFPTPPNPGDPWYAPPTHVIVPDAQGWIEVDPLAGDDGFGGAGSLIGFNTTQPFPDGDPAPSVAAGLEVPTGNQKNGRDVAIIFEATRVGVSGTPDFTNSLPRCRLNNWTEVSLLNLLEFHTGGGTPCSPLTTDLDIEYTVDHELIAGWYVQIITAASPPLVIPTLPPINSPPDDNVTTRGGFGVHHENIAAWPSCSYAVRLYSQRRLTTGINDDDQSFEELTFCK